MLAWAMESMGGNVREARKYAIKAYDLRDKNKAASDWCKEMAAAHLAFNTGGAALAKKLMDEAKASDPSERMEGRLDVWGERHAEIVREGAEVKAMLECLK